MPPEDPWYGVEGIDAVPYEPRVPRRDAFAKPAPSPEASKRVLTPGEARAKLLQKRGQEPAPVADERYAREREELRRVLEELEEMGCSPDGAEAIPASRRDRQEPVRFETDSEANARWHRNTVPNRPEADGPEPEGTPDRLRELLGMYDIRSVLDDEPL